MEARLHGPDGRADVILRLDQGRVKRSRLVRKNGPARIQHRGGAPVGVRPTSLGAHASPGVLFKCDADRRSTPSPVGEKGKRDEDLPEVPKLRSAERWLFLRGLFHR